MTKEDLLLMLVIFIFENKTDTFFIKKESIIKTIAYLVSNPLWEKKRISDMLKNKNTSEIFLFEDIEIKKTNKISPLKTMSKVFIFINQY